MGRTYRIGQAARKLGLNTSVLRYWETEFPQLQPVRTRKGQRLYTDEHLELLAVIQGLLHEQGMTIEGARRKLERDEQIVAAREAGDEETCASLELEELRRSVASELLAMKRLLEGNGA
ncbi:DNA-binding transcriptional MerR regulator [Desulfobaculum xiamenense]|uniref:DNA-binding transcriptional MerR regulator n=1 Tax=Desulfobaculum xiamenense TaxID=995050 RepID=A0A846QM00_9BACT|nr:MerR family transcriptional regulator [Desulfobaculum xiamenense]NJB69131.1 DNA-binding transcriptional MerR regulator [Desulfobaculum xiamenense]